MRLAEQTDRFDMPRLHIDWRYSELDVRTVATAFGLLQRDIAQSALGELRLDPDEADIETVIRRDGAYGGHHIGTARMAHEPAQGVVAKTAAFSASTIFTWPAAPYSQHRDRPIRR